MSGFSEALTRRRYWAMTEQINRLGPALREVPDGELRERVLALKRQRRRGAPLKRLLPEMFALVREASRRAIGIRQYDVQIAGGIGLAEGRVVEMNTGEGKTFIVPLAACLYALDGRGVHVLTANDYLAGRDAAMLKPVYELLGFTESVVLADTPQRDRARAYAADVTGNKLSSEEQWTFTYSLAKDRRPPRVAPLQ